MEALSFVWWQSWHANIQTEKDLLELEAGQLEDEDVSGVAFEGDFARTIAQGQCIRAESTRSSLVAVKLQQTRLVSCNRGSLSLLLLLFVDLDFLDNA